MSGDIQETGAGHTGEKKDRLPAGIDWEEVHRRLEETRLKLGRRPDEVEKKDILRRRARALAKEEFPEPGERKDVLEFFLAHERYGIESSYVREVWPLKELAEVPCTPSFVLGVINVRGQIISVLDLKVFLDLPQRGLGDLNKVIILESDDMEFGVLADSLMGIRSVSLEGLQRSIPTLSGSRGEFFFKGITRDGLILLDAGRLLEDRGVVISEEVTF